MNGSEFSVDERSSFVIKDDLKKGYYVESQWPMVNELDTFVQAKLIDNLLDLNLQPWNVEWSLNHRAAQYWTRNWG